MTFKEYQEKLQYIQTREIIYPTLGLCGETGEIAEKKDELLTI